nr:uncharacterized protein LOC109153907 isoform X5 [Ipomoea batatas]
MLKHKYFSVHMWKHYCSSLPDAQKYDGSPSPHPSSKQLSFEWLETFAATRKKYGLRDMEDLSKAANYYLETASEGYKKRAQKAIDDGESLEDFYNNGKGKQDSNSEDDASSSHPKSSIPHDSSFKDSNFTFTHHDSSNHSKSTHHDDSSSHSKSTQTRGSRSSSTAIEKRNRHGDDVVAALKVGQAIINTGAAVLSIASALGACTIM